jgi:hypothetical protein
VEVATVFGQVRHCQSDGAGRRWIGRVLAAAAGDWIVRMAVDGMHWGAHRWIHARDLHGKTPSVGLRTGNSTRVRPAHGPLTARTISPVVSSSSSSPPWWRLPMPFRTTICTRREQGRR